MKLVPTKAPAQPDEVEFCTCGSIGGEGHTLGCTMERIARLKAGTGDQEGRLKDESRITDIEIEG